jgi:hypothetical protein
MLVTALVMRSPLRLVQGIYPLASVVFFLWMWIIMGIPHPTWVVFLTIPLVEWVLEVIRKQRRKAKRAAQTVDVTPESAA